MEQSVGRVRSVRAANLIWNQLADAGVVDKGATIEQVLHQAAEVEQALLDDPEFDSISAVIDSQHYVMINP